MVGPFGVEHFSEISKGTLATVKLASPAANAAGAASPAASAASGTAAAVPKPGFAAKVAGWKNKGVGYAQKNPLKAAGIAGGAGAVGGFGLGNRRY